MHIPDAKRRKLGDKSEPMILVGYHETGAYRLYHPLNHSIVIRLPDPKKNSTSHFSHVVFAIFLYLDPYLLMLLKPSWSTNNNIILCFDD